MSNTEDTVATDNEDAVSSAPEAQSEQAEDEAAEASPAGASRLEEEGDVAADYLEELLDIADIDGDIDIEVRSGRTYISIVNDDGGDDRLNALVGEGGETLEALQELARLAVLTSTGNRSRLVLDISGHREGRAGQLQRIAEEAVAKAKETGADVALQPMSAYERKLVHDAVAALGLHSESDGEGPRRHIVVSLADS
jgi:spoIIIJ-associated protein